MTKQKITQILRYLALPIGATLMMTSISGMIRYNEAASRYRTAVDPVIDKFVIADSGDETQSLTSDEKLELLSELHRSTFDMDRQGRMPQTKYRLYIGLFLMILGFSIFPSKNKKQAEQVVAPDVE